MNFTKAQGTGNDFILVDAAGMEKDWQELAVAMCDRHFGVGGDGLVLILPSTIADYRMRIFNSDGSEAEMCGNGIRCVARYISEKKLACASADELTIETMAGVKTVGLHKVRGKIVDFKVGMGLPEFHAERIPVAIAQGKRKADDMRLASDILIIAGRSLQLYFVSMGNPHAVYFSEIPVSEFPLSEVGPQVEHHAIFPRRINFEVARVIDRKTIEIRVWERGAGETLACGTGACAVGVASRLLGYTGNKVDIKLTGGVLGVEWDSPGEVFMSGPAEIVFTGDWPER